MTLPAATTARASATGAHLSIEDLVMHFPITQGIFIQRQIGAVRAVDGVSLSVKHGETLGLVGESGSGKSTIGRCLVRLYKPTSGHMYFGDQDLAEAEGQQLRMVRRRIQMVFQDPYASLNPRFTVGSLISEPMAIQRTASRAEIHTKTEELLERVGLNRRFIDRYPHEFSGGQRQRIAIARAISIEPEFIVADEPVSALDVSIRAQIINLMQRLQEQMGLTYLFISHDLSVVRHVAPRVAVMYLGKIMEIADRGDIYNEPLHPYTAALLSAVPVPNPRVEKQRKRIILKGDLPSPINIPSGCRFHTRCPLAQEICRQVEPPLEDKTGRSHFAACHFSDQVGPLTRTGSVQGLGTI
ncbi:MAG TPA: dipeptide ABC transporter ATP-binding protein [Ktedonobacterales bacterium]|jgi:oligopeptide/dipeptide ABC transporter ATP-binding protein|nr:dipeptide ABC transporter ATP-binding protein [Ktedonobacterales bacterium]